MANDRRRLLAALLSTSCAYAIAPASAQDDAEVRAEAEGDVIVVDAVQRRGVTLSPIEPELVLGESEIEAYGVSSLAELLEELAPETGSGRARRGGGRPVVLLNGRRISGFREIGRYPPEALARVEVLPEEAALSYGFSADQRVINFVLKPNVVVRAAEAEVEAPDQGGTATRELSLQRLSVNGSKRFSLDLRFEDQSPLLESERDFTPEATRLPFASPGNLGASDFGQPIGALVGGDPAFTVAALQEDSFSLPIVGARNAQGDQAFRTLRPETTDWQLGFSRSSDFLARSVLTLSGDVQRAESTRLLGLGNITLDLPSSNPFVPFDDGLALYAQVPGNDALFQERETDTYAGGISIVSKPGQVNWTLTGNVEITDEETLTETGIDEAPLQAAVDGGADPFAVLASNLARTERRVTSENRTGEAEFVVNARTLALPAGDVQVSGQLGIFARQLDTVSVDEDGRTATDLSRETFRTQLSVDVPVFDTEAAGRLSINANVNRRDLSDFGALTSLGGGFNYRPTEKLRLLASYTSEEGAPDTALLGNPLLVTPNVRVFDFVTGETVLVDVTSGGNPALLAEAREVAKIGVQINPVEDVRLNFDYTSTVLEDEARDFPALTAEVEAAFPERFTRNAGGDLVALDNRPVNFGEATQRQLRSSLNWSKRLGRSGRPAGMRGGGRPGGRPQTAGGPPQGQPSREAPSREPRAEGTASTERSGPPQEQQADARRSPPSRSSRPGRMSLTLTHVWNLEDTILIREGLPELDLLGGSAIGQNGGTSEHELNLTLRRYNKGLGMFGRLRWQSGTEVDGDLTGGDDLSFSDLLTANLRLSYDLTFSDRLMKEVRWLEDTRVSFGVDNLFDQRIEVTDGTGEIPLLYQPDLIDPLGRVFEFEIRKRF